MYLKELGTFFEKSELGWAAYGLTVEPGGFPNMKPERYL
jgi:hypothetical protein